MSIGVPKLLGWFLVNSAPFMTSYYCLTCFIMYNKTFSFVYYFYTSQVIDKSFGFDTAVEEAQRAINAAHVEAESIENGIGLVKLMGRYSGKLPYICTAALRS